LVVVEKNKEGEVIKKTVKYQDERFKTVYKKPPWAVHISNLNRRRVRN